MSALTEIFGAVDARLSALEGVESYDRMPSGDPDLYPAIEVWDDGDTPASFESSTTQTELNFTVVGILKGFGGPATHDELTDLHACAVFALCGDGGTLGGLVENIEAGARRTTVAQLASARRLTFSQDFTITFATPRGDPRSFA